MINLYLSLTNDEDPFWFINKNFPLIINQWELSNSQWLIGILNFSLINKTLQFSLTSDNSQILIDQWKLSITCWLIRTLKFSLTHDNPPILLEEWETWLLIYLIDKSHLSIIDLWGIEIVVYFHVLDEIPWIFFHLLILWYLKLFGFLI